MSVNIGLTLGMLQYRTKLPPYVCPIYLAVGLSRMVIYSEQFVNIQKPFSFQLSKVGARLKFSEEILLKKSRIFSLFITRGFLSSTNPSSTKLAINHLELFLYILIWHTKVWLHRDTMMCTILRAIVSIKCGHPLKFDEIVTRNVALVTFYSTSAILRTVLHAAISKVATCCNLAFANAQHHMQCCIVWP